MPASYLPPEPVASPAVEMAVTTLMTSTSSTATTTHTVRIYLRSTAVLVTPETYVTDNGLEHIVVSYAGLDEDTTFLAYTAVSDQDMGAYFSYVVDATVDLS